MFTENAKIKKHKETIRPILLIVGHFKDQMELCLQQISIMEKKGEKLLKIKGDLKAQQLNAIHVLV